jgi:hypothetical protein
VNDNEPTFDENDGFYAQPDRDTSVQFTIFELPPDFPKHYVVRRVEIRKGGELVITKLYRLARTLKEARAQVPAGLYPLGRHPSDARTIVETWI